MEMNEYQKKAKTFDVSCKSIDEITRDEYARRVVQLAHSMSGLAEEIGEVQGKFKKFIRGDKTYEELQLQVYDELGDVLWYLSDVASNLGLNLSDIAKNNIEKLTDRKLRGKIKGDGDHR